MCLHETSAPPRSQSMRVPLRVLIAEDSEDDARLLLRELQQAGYQPTFERVDTPAAMTSALDRHAWDLVIGDYSMPAFSGPAALALLRARDPDTPFIFVSGTIGEDVAVEAMKAGAPGRADLRRGERPDARRGPARDVAALRRGLGAPPRRGARPHLDPPRSHRNPRARGQRRHVHAGRRATQQDRFDRPAAPSVSDQPGAGRSASS